MKLTVFDNIITTISEKLVHLAKYTFENVENSELNICYVSSWEMLRLIRDFSNLA